MSTSYVDAQSITADTFGPINAQDGSPLSVTIESGGGPIQIAVVPHGARKLEINNTQSHAALGYLRLQRTGAPEQALNESTLYIRAGDGAVQELDAVNIELPVGAFLHVDTPRPRARTRTRWKVESKVAVRSWPCYARSSSRSSL